MPASAPVDWSKPEYEEVKVAWREDIHELERRRLEAQLLPKASYRERVEQAQTTRGSHGHRPRPHLGGGQRPSRHDRNVRSRNSSSSSGSCASATGRAWRTLFAAPARSLSKPRGSAAMFTPPTLTRWPACSPGAPSTSSVAPSRSAEKLARDQQELVAQVQAEIDRLGSRPTADGWRAKVFLYCVEVAARRPAGWFRCCRRLWSARDIG